MSPAAQADPETVIVTLTGSDNFSVSVGDGTGQAAITDLNGSRLCVKYTFDISSRITYKMLTER